MAEQSLWSWEKAPTLALLAVLWVALALHAAIGLRRYGRRWWVWFIISVFLTVIPATIVSYIEYFRRRQRELSAAGVKHVRCRHCGAVLAERDLVRAGGNAVCPNCQMVIGDEHLV